MPTLGEAAVALEEQWFVGRQHELVAFEQWLAAPEPTAAVLDVSGHGGVGKSTLLRAFARRAQRLGHSVILADSHDFPHTPEGMAGALTPTHADDLPSHLNATRPLILLDTCEELGPLQRYLYEEPLP